jgi:hypothetical protein
MPQATAPVPMSRNVPSGSIVPGNEASVSGISWAAVAGGSFVTAALLLSLSALGAGMGLSSISPWANAGVSPSAVGMGAMLWLAFAEIIACGLGGYVAGRLRTKWVDVHSDEVYFRDTAHGFLVWAVALVMMAAFLTSAATVLAGGENRGANASRSEGPAADANRYYVDSMFRSAKASSPADDAARAEAGMIFAHSLGQRELTPEDKNYVAEMVAAKTGVARPDAERRVTDAFEQARQAADTARKAVAHSLYWMFLALLLGAFAASLAATFGGKQRDHVRT